VVKEVHILRESAENRPIGGVKTEGGPSLRPFAVTDSVGNLHAPLPLEKPLIRVGYASDTALVLGRSQKEEIVNHDYLKQNKIDLVRRESGGGAVFVTPENMIWVDVVVPRSHALWEDDVNRAFYWLGESWAQIISGSQVHKGEFVCNDLCRLVCFAGVGPGEVTLEDKKIVGISQRRTREGARFQCAVMLNWEPEIYEKALNSNLAVGVAKVGQLTKDLASEVVNQMSLEVEQKLMASN
jgi:lipoate-protein ligase A